MSEKIPDDIFAPAHDAYDALGRGAIADVKTIARALLAERMAEREKWQDKIDGLEADLDSAVEVAWHRGAYDWVRLNYPKHFERLKDTRPKLAKPIRNQEKP